MKLRVDLRYGLLALAIFAVEVAIALWVNEEFVRPFVGDVLVVVLIYCSVKTFVTGHKIAVAVGTLLFAFLVETAQGFDAVTRLGLQDSRLARTVIGTSFSWIDVWCYVIGIVMVLVLESIGRKSDPPPSK